MLLFGKFKKTLEEVSLNDWIAISEKNDLRKLYYSKKLQRQKLIFNYEKLIDAYLVIEQCYIDAYGLSTQSKSLTDKKKKLVSLRLAYLSTGDRLYLTKIDLLMQEIEQLQGFTPQSMKFSKFIGVVEKQCGFAFDREKTSLKEFYDRL